MNKGKYLALGPVEFCRVNAAQTMDNEASFLNICLNCI